MKKKIKKLPKAIAIAIVSLIYSFLLHADCGDSLYRRGDAGTLPAAGKPSD